MSTNVCRRLTLKLFLLVAGVARAALGAETTKPADAPNPHVWSPRIRSVAVFKNGMGFFLREGSVQPREGWAVAKDIPPAAFGTLAVFSKDPQELVDVVGSGPGEIVEFDGVDAPRDSRRSRLLTALKLNIQLTYRYQGADRAAAGRLVSVGEEFAVLESENGNLAVPIEGISRLQVLELPLRIHVASAAEKPAVRTTLAMAYLREGITWVPEYTLKVLDDVTAELTLRGTLINEAEDLIHCDVNFVVGVPHFVHTSYKAPIAIGQVIRTIGAAIAPPELRSQLTNRMAIVSNVNTAPQFGIGGAVVETPNASDEGMLSGVLGTLPHLDGPGGSDYTVYTKRDLTIRRGERAIVTLFVKKVRYGHIYRWSPPQMLEHFFVLHNDTDSAWTTGPCLAVSGDQPLSEDLLRYTPKGGRAEVPVSAAINIAHEKTEVETDRRLKAHSPSDRVFLDLVMLSGELQLRNFEKTAAEIVIVVSVPGKPFEASDEGQKSADPAKLQLLDRAGTIRWKISLKPGESKVLRYKYERYVPSS
ncbi:MAG: hypothetical protein ACT4QC_22050 [Planctomycetaceae bacterium]